MLIAETVTFDPGIVVLAFLIFLAVCLAASTVVFGGLVAGVRAARNPSSPRAAATWTTCTVIEVAALVLSIATGWEEGAAALMLVLAVSALARFAPTPRA